MTKMIVVDTSAWIEYLNDGNPLVVQRVDQVLRDEVVAMGDLIFCEILQGLKVPRHIKEVTSLLSSLPRYDMVGFRVAQQAASNYRLLRSRGVTVRKTIDVIIGTFCAMNDFALVHNDSDFNLMAPHIGLKVWPAD